MHPPVHSAYYLGVVGDIRIMTAGGGSTSPSRSDSSPTQEDLAIAPRPPEVQLIDRVEAAQLNASLPYDAHEGNCPLVRLAFSKHGLKIIHSQTQEVLDRVPLHRIAEAVSFDDDLGHFNVIIKVGQVGKNHYAAYVFQTSQQSEATSMCQTLNEVYESIINM